MRIQTLPDLQAATKWLTNSNCLWQGVSNLLSKEGISLFLHVNPPSPKLKLNVRISR
jgi:hypothetical protein